MPHSIGGTVPGWQRLDLTYKKVFLTLKRWFLLEEAEHDVAHAKKHVRCTANETE